MNKQIITDGIDVSGCKCIIEDYQRANNFEGRYEHIKNVCELGERGAEYYNLFCKDNPNCYYKQLKRKEQECEEWKLKATSLDYADEICALEIDLKLKEQEIKELKQEVQYLKSEIERIGE